MNISRLSYTCDHGEAASDCYRCLRADLAKAQAEVAELRARIDRSVCLDSEGERIHFGARVVCGQCFDSQEQHLKNARTRLADAEKVLGFVRHPWRIEHIGFTGLYDVVRSPPSGRETLGHGSYPKSIAQTCCDAANREPVDNYDLKWRVGK